MESEGVKISELIEESERRYAALCHDYDPVTGEGAELWVGDGGDRRDILERRWVSIPDHLIPREYAPKEYYNNPLVKKVLSFGTIENFAKNYCTKESEKLNKSIRMMYNFDKSVKDLIDETRIMLLLQRYRSDFICWAYCEVKIKPKVSDDNVEEDVEFEIDDNEEKYYGDNWESEMKERDNGLDYSLVPFKLNHAQFITLCEFEDKRTDRKPLRFVIGKSRQWGGSTLTQIYMAWLQMLHRNGLYSCIVAQQASTAKKIKMMYEKLISQYDSSLIVRPNGERLQRGEKLRFAQYGNSQSDYRIVYGNMSSIKTARDVVVSIGTYNKPDSLPGSDISLAHFSEVAIWKKTLGKEPEDVVRSVMGGMAYRPYTMAVMESTFRGSGNYFANEFLAALKGENGYKAIFISCMDVIFDTMEVKDKVRFAEWLLSVKDNEECPATGIPEHLDKPCLDSGRYYWKMWEMGACFESIMWYMLKATEFKRKSDLHSEAPIDYIQALTNTTKSVFDTYDLAELAKCVQPPKFRGDIDSDYKRGKDVLKDFVFTERSEGNMLVWEKPEYKNIRERYLVVVDIGGTWKGADWSIIRVFDRIGYMENKGEKEKTVLMYHGHVEHNELAWKAVQVATWYDNALLVFESNTLDTRDKERDVDDGEHIEYILKTIDYNYNNLFCRTENTNENMGGSMKRMYGFHTNRKTKPEMVSLMKQVVRYNDYVERDQGTIDEARTYERTDTGAYAAMSGCKDDRLMTAMIGLVISRDERYMGMPRVAKPRDDKAVTDGVINKNISTVNEAAF